jgi:hypothetical protein
LAGLFRALNFFRTGTGALHTSVQQTIQSARELHYHAAFFRAGEIRDLNRDLRNVVTGKVCGIDLDGVNDTAGGKLEDRPIVAGFTAAAGFPTILHVVRESVV